MSRSADGGREVALLTAEMEAALAAAFGDATVTELAPIAGGRSGASVLGFTCEGVRWVIRQGEPRAVQCARIAAALGVAPALKHGDDANGIAIMARVDGAPFGGCRDRAVIARVAEALRKVHDGPAFPPSIATHAFFAAVNDLYRQHTGQAFPAQLVRVWEDCHALTEHFPLAPCHRDLNPGNVLTTDERVYFLDWDTAGASDPLLDVSLLGVFGVPVPDDRAFMQEAYLGRAPNAVEAARFVVGRVQALAFYAVSMHYVAAITKRVRVADPVPMRELRAHLDDPIVVGVSLLAEAARLRAEPSFASAAQSCAGSRSRSDASTRS